MQPPFVNPSEASEALAQNCRQLLSNWPSLAGPVLVFYDYILMLPTEMHLIWRHPKPWFLLIRYLALATNIIVVVSTFGNFGPERLIVWISCKWLPMIKKSFLIVQEIIIYAILTLRVYALFNRHQAILMLLSVVGLGSLAIGIWLGTTTDTTAPPPGSPCSPCILTHVSKTLTGVAGAWEAGLFRDVLIFGFTLLRGILHWRRADHSPCVDCFVIDGILIAAVNVANILMYYPLLAGSLAWLASALSAVLITRLMLNMREVVDTGVYGTDVGAIVSEADDESVVEWNGIPLRQMGGHVRNRASRGHVDDFDGTKFISYPYLSFS
ncbi:hypothetical protein B0H14DRAFT_2692384 [Mycena olivaceomarginata]|nr:hypothetical protein B0H14DRAFT_2692384 [Mycena olivaceomarginata]